MLPSPGPGVLFQALPDGAVLLDTRSEVYFGLNAVGARVWQLLPAARTLDELCTAVAAEYPDADPRRVRTDVENLVAALVAEGLLGAAPAARNDDAALAGAAA
ncbi:MAG TPA: PqqD family protein [Longimicrobium sp.]